MCGSYHSYYAVGSRNFARVESASPNARPASSSRTATSVSTEKARSDSVVDVVLGGWNPERGPG